MFTIFKEEKVILLSQREHVLPPDPSVPWDGPEDLSAKLFFAWDHEYFIFSRKLWMTYIPTRFKAEISGREMSFSSALIPATMPFPPQDMTITTMNSDLPWAKSLIAGIPLRGKREWMKRSGRR